jgi:predicted RNase H-like HicB family nuclease
MKYVFPAILEKDKEANSVYNVSFPDLLGVYTFGTTRKEAILMARDVLKEVLLVAEDLRDITPTPYEELSKLYGDVIKVEVEL